MKGPKILLLDIETAPNLADVWGLFKQNIALSQLRKASYILSWAAKWYGERPIFFDSVQHDKAPKVMLQQIWELLNEADLIVHYNGRHFDIPTLNRDFFRYKMGPPAPYKQIDLLETVRKQFRFASAKLAHVTVELGLPGKIKVDHELWQRCMAGEAKAWSLMEKYNKKDVTELEKLYDLIKPWITNHPNVALYMNETKPVCPVCGSAHLQKRGMQVTTTLTYQRYQCQKCGAWPRDVKPAKEYNKALVKLIA